MKIIPCLLPATALFVLSLVSPRAFAQPPISIPLGGNAWSNHPGDTLHGRITEDGITGWDDPSTSFTVWFRVSRPGSLNISLLASVPAGSSTISVSLGGGSAMTHELTLKGARLHNCSAGAWTVLDSGYQVVEIRGLKRSGTAFATIQSLTISGSAAAMPVAFVPDNKGNFYYWGRRGPSVHLNYSVPDSTAAVRYFYNEVTVPAEQDIIGSYFMADGFSVGYFGMQVNSATERRILFSVWSPYATDNPAEIPDSARVRLARKGPDVHTGSFGNEGSGGQSYLVYPWVAGRTYRFLLGAQLSPLTLASSAKPAPDFIRFTAWFYAPEAAKWCLIASWDRPSTRNLLQHLHSFVENFEPDYGDQGRSALFSNLWICDINGRWFPLTHARFTGDNTARKGYRLDYAGGVLNDAFFLRNGGFFSKPTPLDTWLTKPVSSQTSPDIDLKALP